VGDYYDRLGDLIRDRLDTDEDPFESWDPHEGRARQAGNTRGRTPPPRKPLERARARVPEELVESFRVLQLPPGVGADECKAAWKRLLHRHHPDRAGTDAKSQEAATAASIRITEAYRRIARWYETGQRD